MADPFIVVVAVVVAGLVIAGLWYAAQPRCVLLFSLERGRLRLVRGKTTTAFMEAAQSICSEFGLTDGEIRGFRRGRHVTLSFSPTFPPDVQQRLRNVWQLSR